MSTRSRKTVCLQNGAPRGRRRWLWLVVGVSGVSRRKQRTPIRRSFFRTVCRFRLSRPIRSPGCRRFRFRLRGGSLLGWSRKRRYRQRRRRWEHERRRREHRRQRRRLQHDDGAELGFGCGQCGGSDGRERDGARSDVCDGVQLSECGASGGGSASGAFQMINSTYAADINGAVAYDPAISGSIVSGLPGQMDPTTEAYAASYELRTDALALRMGNF